MTEVSRGSWGMRGLVCPPPGQHVARPDETPELQEVCWERDGMSREPDLCHEGTRPLERAAQVRNWIGVPCGLLGWGHRQMMAVVPSQRKGELNLRKAGPRDRSRPAPRKAHALLRLGQPAPSPREREPRPGVEVSPGHRFTAGAGGLAGLHGDAACWSMRAWSCPVHVQPRLRRRSLPESSPPPPGLPVVTGLPGTLDTDGTAQPLERVVGWVSIPVLATLPP